jgi:hypothetical protein
MDELKGFADVAKHLLYETLGLLVPGAALVAAMAITIGGNPLNGLLAFMDSHRWLALFGAYVMGYVVQGVSRPVTTVADTVLGAPVALLRAITRILPIRARNLVERRVERLNNFLLKRHAHKHGGGTIGAVAPVSFNALILEYWSHRLTLSRGEQLTTQQGIDLSFSALMAERERLDRFRAAASLARGVSVAVVAAMAVIVTGFVKNPGSLSWMGIGAVEGLVIAFYGLMERADMYDRLWNAVLPAHLLSVATRDHPLQRTQLDINQASNASPAAAISGALAPGLNGPARTNPSLEAAAAVKER